MVFFITATRTRKWYSGFISLFEVSSTKEEESLTWVPFGFCWYLILDAELPQVLRGLIYDDQITPELYQRISPIIHVEGKDVTTVSCSPMNSSFELVVVFWGYWQSSSVRGTSGVPKQSQAQQAEAKCYSSNNRMGLRAGANPSFTSQGTEAIINSINGSQCSVN